MTVPVVWRLWSAFGVNLKKAGNLFIIHVLIEITYNEHFYLILMFNIYVKN
jgi:hypothetical protein